MTLSMWVTATCFLLFESHIHALSGPSLWSPRSQVLGARSPTALSYRNDVSPTTTKPKKLPTLGTGKKKKMTGRKKWGVDKDHHDEYWFNKRIHTLGNTGFLGAVHAAISPIATKMIDDAAYGGTDIRQSISKELAGRLQSSKARVLDLCCGVGISTRALQKAFPDAEKIIGMDTSPEMISMASFLDKQESLWSQHLIEPIKKYYDKVGRSLRHQQSQTTKQCRATFMEGNAEKTHFKKGSFDLVTIMYAFHEAPKEGRSRMIQEARRLLRRGGILALIDISPDYHASRSMLAGEPYVLEYQKNIQKQVQKYSGFARAAYKTLVPGHVACWVLKRE